MREFFALLTVVLSIWSTAHYCALTKRRTITPVLATWIIFGAGNILALLAYFHGDTLEDGRPRDPVNTIGSIVWAATSWVTVWFIAKWHMGERKFEPVHVFCVVAAFAATVAWALTENEILAFVAFQGIMVAAYSATFHRLWITDHQTEPAGPWFIGLANSMASAMPALLSAPRDWLAALHGMRSTACVAVILLLMLRIRLKAHRNIPNEEIRMAEEPSPSE